MFLLDTNVISELRKSRPHGAVLSWFLAYNSKAFFLPSVVIYELQAGVEQTRRQDVVKAQRLDEWIDQILSGFQVLDYDAAAARLAAQFMEGKSGDLLGDAMIAAVAKVNNLAVATRNVRDFRSFSVQVVDPFHTGIQ